MSTIKTILHPTDFSPCSEHAMRLACSLARDQQAKLMLLHVVERPEITYAGVAMAPPAPPPVEEREAARQQLEQVKSPFAGLTIERRLVEGMSSSAILQIAEELKPDLIVMGTHGRSGVGRLLMGSVAESVVREAKCPVLTVKTPVFLG